MRLSRITVFLIFAGVLFNSCKNQEVKDSSTEINNIETGEPVVIESENIDENSTLINNIENYILTEYLTERDLRTIPKDQRKFQLALFDLNNDGKDEIFINFITHYFCGTGGCNVLLLNDKMESITEFTVTRTPIYIEKSLENDWRILMLQSEEKWRKLIFKDGSYPSNPSLVEISKSLPTESADILFDNDAKTLKTYNF